MRLKDLTGKRFGHLTVLSRAGNKGKHIAWLCQCDCGNQAVIQGNHLAGGRITRCSRYCSSFGRCSHKETPMKSKRRALYTHCDYYIDARNSRLYKSVFNKMFQRCYNKNSKDYKNYGARGIAVCDEWHDFVNFRNWALKNGYDETAPYGECTLDRVDVNGNYCPENCRFVGLKEQCRNKQYNHFVTYKGETKTIAEWSEITGISESALYSRFNRGWSAEKAFTKPVRKRAR